MNDDTKQAVAELIEAAGEAAEEVVRHRHVRRLARLGFYSKGFLFVVIGAIALMVVAGVRGAKLTDQQGALAAVAQEPSGRIFLIIFVVGAAAHGIWNILRAVVDIDNVGRSWFAILKRVIAVLTGVFYFGLGVAAAEIVFASRVQVRSSQAEETFVTVLLALPIIGFIWAETIGLGLVGAGISEAYSGLSGGFRNSYRRWHVTGRHGAVITVLAWLSFTVRAVLLVVMGWFFLKAPFVSRTGPIGLDAALLTLLGTTYGRTLVAFAGIGLIAHGILAFYEARYRKLW